MAEYEEISRIKKLQHKVTVWLYVATFFAFMALCYSALNYGVHRVEGFSLLKTPEQAAATVLIPLLLTLFMLAWNCLRSLRPKKYRTCADYWHGAVWHLFQPRTKRGIALIKDLKDLVRGTIYADLNHVIEAYELFKNLPGIEVVAIKEKIQSLNNITINFVYQKRFIGEM